MVGLDRETLEKTALEQVCACYYYDLADSIDAVSDAELEQIIRLPFASHLLNQEHNPQDIDEYINELCECPDIKRGI